MTVRVTATVPDYVGDAINRLAGFQGREPSQAAAFLLEQAVIEGLKAGLIPPVIPGHIDAAIKKFAKENSLAIDHAIALLLEKSISEDNAGSE